MKKYFCLIIFVCLFFNIFPQNRKPILLVDPAGNVSDVGRKLGERYERGATLKFAESLQKKAEEKYNVRVILTRSPGEEILPFQNASFSNRLGADFFIRLQLYRESTIKPKIFLYHLVFDPMVDFAKRNIDSLTFVPVYQAHFANINKTKSFGKKIYDSLNLQLYRKYFDVDSLQGVPLKHLVGIQAPALTIECGISYDDQWKSLVDPIVESLRFLNDQF